jgi:hypothetical protein
MAISKMFTAAGFSRHEAELANTATPKSKMPPPPWSAK